MRLFDIVLLCVVCSCTGRRSRLTGGYRTLSQVASRYGKSGRDPSKELALFLIKYADSDISENPPSAKGKGKSKGKGKKTGKGKAKGKGKGDHPSGQGDREHSTRMKNTSEDVKHDSQANVHSPQLATILDKPNILLDDSPLKKHSPKLATISDTPKNMLDDSPLKKLVETIRKDLGGGEEQKDKQPEKQPAFAGNWRTARSVGLDPFLKEAMGVSKLKRKMALKASQTQRVYQKSSVVHLEITDRRGTAHHMIIPDGKSRSARGYRKLPIRQKAKWGLDGALIVEEKYSQQLGGDLHDTKCRGGKCPLIVSRRFVTKNGQMVVELERKLSSGKTVRTRTYFDPIKGRSLPSAR